MFIGRTDAEAETPILWPPEELTHWKRLWCLEGLKARVEEDDRGWDGWMASPTRWTWVWVNSGSWWWTGRPVMLQSTGSQRVRHYWATELNWAISYSRGSSQFIYQTSISWIASRFFTSESPGKHLEPLMVSFSSLYWHLSPSAWETLVKMCDSWWIL